MTPQERNMLSDLIVRVEGTRLPEKDGEAEELLQQRLGRNPNALYILAQTVLVQKYALDQAKAQMDQLRQQAQQAQQSQHKPGGFLDSIFGHRDESEQRPQPSRQYAAPAPASYAPAQQSYPPQQSGYAPAPSGGGSSFLRSAATTAAGVAAGALAFQGVESLMHGFGHAAGFGGGGGFMGGGMPMEETVVNNYYDSPGGGGDQAGNAGFNPSSDASGMSDANFLPQTNDADLSPQLDQADDVNVTGNDTSAFDSNPDANLDDTSFDDGGSFDGGGDFSGDDGSDYA